MNHQALASKEMLPIAAPYTAFAAPAIVCPLSLSGPTSCAPLNVCNIRRRCCLGNGYCRSCLNACAGRNNNRSRSCQPCARPPSVGFGRCRTLVHVPSSSELSNEQPILGASQCITTKGTHVNNISGGFARGLALSLV